MPQGDIKGGGGQQGSSAVGRPQFKERERDGKGYLRENYKHIYRGPQLCTSPWQTRGKVGTHHRKGGRGRRYEKKIEE